MKKDEEGRMKEERGKRNSAAYSQKRGGI